METMVLHLTGSSLGSNFCGMGDFPASSFRIIFPSRPHDSAVHLVTEVNSFLNWLERLCFL